jgi:hypothetical protein
MEAHQASLTDMVGPHHPAIQFFHLPVGTLGLQEIGGGATLADVKASGCRILSIFRAPLPVLNSAVISCEMTHPTPHEPARFRSIAHTDLVEHNLPRIAEAHGMDATQTEDFEVRFLSIPGIHLQALHLVRKGPGGDLILPVLSEDSRFPIHAILTVDAFHAAATAIARERLAHTRSERSS